MPHVILSPRLNVALPVSQGTEYINNLVGYENSGGALTAREQLASEKDRSAWVTVFE